MKRHHWIYKGDYEDWFGQNKMNTLSNWVVLWVLIDDILDLAKVDSGKWHLRKFLSKSSRLFLMLQLFEQNFRKKLPLLKNTNKLDFIIGDPVRLPNHSSWCNAIKFTSKGKVTVAVDLFQESEHNVVLKFSIGY
jgi:hypothetical protein